MKIGGFMEFLEKLKECSEAFEYCVGVNNDEIQFAEKQLGIIFPNIYKKFLLECGMVLFGDTHIEGIYKINGETYFPIIEITKLLRNEICLGKEFLVLQYEVDEYADIYKTSNDGIDLGIYGIEIKKDANNQNNIVSLIKKNDNFEDYFNDFIELGE
jgi:hypothetical protein